MRFDSNIPKLKDAYAARHEPEAARFLAQAYWAFTIVVLALLVACSITYGVWEFFQMPKGDEISSVVRPQATFTKAQLQGVLQAFGDRAARFQVKMTAPVGTKDPSQ